MATTIEQMDERLAKYYEKNGKDDYYEDEDNKTDDSENKGKFARWCEDNGYEDDDIKEEFEGDAKDAMVPEFDDDFPLILQQINITEQQKNYKIFRILKNIFENRAQIFVDDFTLKAELKQIKETYNLYKNNIKTWGKGFSNTQLTDINILYFITISRIETNNNFLLNLIDSYKRDIIEETMNISRDADNNKDVTEYKTNAEEERLMNWISKRPFLKELNEKLKAIKINANAIEAMFDDKENKEEHKDKQFVLDLASIIKTYPTRIGPRLRPGTGRLIDDDLQMVARYIVASATFIDHLINVETKQIGGPPTLIDFIILLPPTVCDDKFEAIDHNPGKHNNNDGDSDDDDDDDYDAGYIEAADVSGAVVYDEDIIGDVESDIKQNEINGCIYHRTKVADILDEIDEKENGDIEHPRRIARKCMQSGFQELRGKLVDKDATYPQNRRFNIIFDRRDFYKKDHEENDILLVFQPPNDCNKIPNRPYPPEIFFDLSRICLIPRPGYIPDDKGNPDNPMMMKQHSKNQEDDQIKKLKAETIDATTISQGQIMTFSYHIWAADEIKCYLLWQGQCHRFYPQDIIEVLPKMFKMNKKNEEFIKSAEVKRLVKEMKIPDTKFEKFYRGLNRLQYSEFPRQYDAPNEVYPEFGKNQPPL